MTIKSTASIVLFVILFLSFNDSPATEYKDKSGITLKAISETIYRAENPGKPRLRLKESNVIELKSQITPGTYLTGNRITLGTSNSEVTGLKRSVLMSEAKPDLRNDKVDLSRLFPKDYKPWESSRHFGLAVGEGALFNIFIPWAMARWGRDWDTVTVERWPFIGWQSMWSNIQGGWNYDGDNFLTNMFSHPYGGNLFYNSGRSNGYNFWESSAFALAGSFLWETFMETNPPAINDWVNTGIDGAAFGEVLHRLSTIITDNTARGSRRVWTEIAAGIINPVRLFTRLVTGEVSKVFPNPSYRKPDDLVIALDAGTRSLLEEDETHNPEHEQRDLDGMFELLVRYGNPHKAEHSTPFSHFTYNIAFASSAPNLTSMNIMGSLFAINISKSEEASHSLETTLNYNYVNNPGFLYGSTSFMENLNSYFKVKEKSSIRTRLGLKLIPMGGTPNDYFYDSLDGRGYDFGQGLGVLGAASYYVGEWEVFTINYAMDYIWTQSQPNNSKHFLQGGSFAFQLPLRDYFVVGLGMGYYKRLSYYFYPPGYFGFNVPGRPETNAPDVRFETPVVRLFFKTRIL